MKRLDVKVGAESNMLLAVKKVTKKRRILGVKEFNERLYATTSKLESARAYIKASEPNLHIIFYKFVELVTKSAVSDPLDRKSIALLYLSGISSLIKLILEVYSIITGKSIKKNLTVLRKTLENSYSKSSKELESDALRASDFTLLIDK